MLKLISRNKNGCGNTPPSQCENYFVTELKVY